MKTRASPRSRSLSLADLVGEMTINRWNSDSSFEEKSIGADAVEGVQIADVGMDGVADNLTPSRPKRLLSPDELTPVGRTRKMSTEISNSPILRMRYEYWELEDKDNGGGIVGIAPVNGKAHISPPTTNVRGRYGLVEGLSEITTTGEIPTAPVESTGARYGLVVEAEDTSNGQTVEAEDTCDLNEARIKKTPRRRLASASVFERMMLNTSQLQRNRSKSVSSRPRGGRTAPIPSSQKLISAFITPKRGNGL